MMEMNRQDDVYERISDYIDGRLSAEDSASFKQNLETDADLRSSYETILATRLLLNHSPKRRAPRNFTLSEKTAYAIRRQRIILPVLRFSSAFSSAAAVIIFAIVMFTNHAALVAPMQLAAAPMAEKNAATASTPIPPIIVWGSPATGMGGGGGGGYGGGGAEGSGLVGGGAAQPMPQPLGAGAPSSITSEAMPTQSPEQVAPAIPEAPAAPSIKSSEPTAPAGLAPSQPSAADNMQVQATQALPAISGSGPILGIRPTQQSATRNILPEAASESPQTSKVIWIVISALLLLIGAGAGITSILISRKR